MSIKPFTADFTADHVPVWYVTPEVIDSPLTINGCNWSITCLRMNEPYCVLFRDDLEELPLPQLAPMFENAPIFPQGVHVLFVRVLDNAALQVRGWLRGTGESDPGVEGVCAAAAAAVRVGHVPAETPIPVTAVGTTHLVTVKNDFSVCV